MGQQALARRVEENTDFQQIALPLDLCIGEPKVPIGIST